MPTPWDEFVAVAIDIVGNASELSATIAYIRDNIPCDCFVNAGNFHDLRVAANKLPGRNVPIPESARVFTVRSVTFRIDDVLKNDQMRFSKNGKVLAYINEQGL